MQYKAHERCGIARRIDVSGARLRAGTQSVLAYARNYLEETGNGVEFYQARR